MTDRFKTRPKSVTSGLQRASVSTNNLHFSVVKSTDSQWKPNNGGMWVADASNLLGGGIKGSKCTTHSWQMNLGPQTGGFLPILKVKSRIHSSRRQKRNKSATARSLDSMTKSAGKVSAVTNTASFLDMTTLTASHSMSDTKHRSSAAKLQRQASLPLSLSLQVSSTSSFQMPTAASSPGIPPVLKYSHDKCGADNVGSKLDILDSPRSTKEEKGQSASIGLNTEAKIKKPSPPPPKQNSADSAPNQAVKNSDSKVAQHELVTYKKPLIASELNNLKWKLDVNLPVSLSTAAEPSDSQGVKVAGSISDLNNNATDDIIDSVKEHNIPKSILKPKSESDTSTSDKQNKQSVGMSTYVLTPPVPPMARQQSANSSAANKKRILRARSAVQYSQTNQNDSSLPSSPNSTDNDNDGSSPGDSGTAEMIKSVRFAAQPNHIKEYMPWEAPQYSFLNHTRPAALSKAHTFIL